jgi:hypothetical protein
MLDRITGMPIVIAEPAKEISKVLPKIIESKIEQYNIAWVLFILVSAFLCVVFIFI